MESIEALRDRLLEGNLRFVEDRTEHPHTDAARRAKLLSGQRPFATVLGCADSRVPAERIFDQGLGHLYTVRVAGNVATRSVIGSIEFAAEVLGVRLLLVLGHEGCGAVKATLDDVSGSDYLESILGEIRPAIRTAAASGETSLEAITRVHAIGVARALPERSAILHSRVESGDLLILPSLYRLETGRVELL